MVVIARESVLVIGVLLIEWWDIVLKWQINNDYLVLSTPSSLTIYLDRCLVKDKYIRIPLNVGCIYEARIWLGTVAVVTNNDL